MWEIEIEICLTRPFYIDSVILLFIEGYIPYPSVPSKEEDECYLNSEVYHFSGVF